MVDRFHKAARDGYLEVLKEATRKDLNTKDEDGMTPTLWASFEGNLDALRLIVGRGGDPDKCDNYGNTALHFAAARGHLTCLSFLVNFGVNMWSLDIDFHTAKDLAAINNRDDILRFLDAAIGKEEAKDPKKVKNFKDKAIKDAEKRAKDFEKLQKKASKSAEEEQKKLSKQRKEMERHGTVKSGFDAPRPSMAFLSLRKDSRLLYSNSPKFSEIVANQQTNQQQAPVKNHTGVYRKVQQKRGQTVSGTKSSNQIPDSDFKVADIEADGKRSVRSLTGLRRDSEVMYVPKYDISTNNMGKRGKINGLFEDINSGENESNEVRGGSESPPLISSRGTVGRRAGSISGIGMSRSISQPDYMQQVGTDSGFNEAIPSIFERPGFGSVAFRNSITSTMANFTGRGENEHRKDSIGSASSLKHRGNGSTGGSGAWEEHSDEDDDVELGATELFLAAAGLTKYIPIFVQEKIDLESLMLLTDEDFKSMGIEMGPRRKLLKAIMDRQSAIEDPSELVDSRL